MRNSRNRNPLIPNKTREDRRLNMYLVTLTKHFHSDKHFNTSRTILSERFSYHNAFLFVGAYQALGIGSLHHDISHGK